MDQEILACRLCENTQLVEVLDLGVQALGNVFPKAKTEHVSTGPVKLTKCTGHPDVCGLLQLACGQSEGDLQRSTPDRSLGEQDSESVIPVERVRTILERLASLEGAGCAPSVSNCYPELIDLVAGLPPGVTVRSTRERRDVLITPFAALASREQPFSLLQQIRDLLDDCSVCVLEERYMPWMLQRNAYDFVCHEHVAYCGLKQIKWMTDRAELKIVDIAFDQCDTGTISLALTRRRSPYAQCSALETILDEEARAGLHTLNPYRDFAQRVTGSVSLLRTFLDRAKGAGKSVSALGASKEGNVILQCCHVTQGDIGQIGESDPSKVGAFTPGTLLPIVAEEDVLATEPNFLLMLPWQLREMFFGQPKFVGRNLVFPLPKLEVIHPAFSQ